MSSFTNGPSAASEAPRGAAGFRPTSTDGPIFHSTLAVLEALCAVSSPTGDRDGLIQATGVYGELLADRGLQVEVVLEKNAAGVELPVLIARSGSDLDGPSGLFLIGHMDTVLPAAPASYRDARLYATGAADMKGGLACFVGAVDQLQAEGYDLPHDLTLVVVPDEEVAGEICHAVVRRFGATARAMWVLEPGRRADEAPEAFTGGNADDGETIVLARRGLIKWYLDVHGRGAHAGSAYWQGRSAAGSAARWVAAALDLARPGAGPTVNAGRIVAGERAFVEDLADQAGLLFSDRQTNVVPDRARVEGEMRFRSEAEGDELIRRLAGLATDIAERDGTELHFDAYQRVPAWSRAPGSPAAPAEEAAIRRGWTLKVEPDRGGISFPNMLRDPSALPILDGLGPTGGGLHTRNEFVDLCSIDRRIRLLADLLAHDLGAG